MIGEAMRTKSEEEWLLKAIDAFGKRFIVVSPDFEILAASRSSDRYIRKNIIGLKYHDVFNDRSSPCLNCEVKTPLITKSRPCDQNQKSSWKPAVCRVIMPTQSMPTAKSKRL
jgi:hypothetical protein